MIIYYTAAHWPSVSQSCRCHASVVIGHSRHLDGASSVKRDDVISGRA